MRGITFGLRSCKALGKEVLNNWFQQLDVHSREQSRRRANREDGTSFGSWQACGQIKKNQDNWLWGRASATLIFQEYVHLGNKIGKRFNKEEAMQEICQVMIPGLQTFALITTGTNSNVQPTPLQGPLELKPFPWCFIYSCTTPCAWGIGGDCK